MNITDTLEFFINYMLWMPIICFILCAIGVLKRYYRVPQENLSFLEQEKLIKKFQARFIDLKNDKDLQLRELYAQQITNYPNVTGRFVAYCLKREICNLSFVSYLFNYSHKKIDMSDSYGDGDIFVKDSKLYTVFFAFVVPLLIIMLNITISSLWPYELFSLFQSIVYMLLAVIFAILSVNSFCYLCVFFLSKSIEITKYGELEQSSRFYAINEFVSKYL
ncbi:hypothetical protein NK318_01160 [Acinetobacter junii]|uniref:hypothetical protein n=1 Tax=Acinetobacter junii TaxID=40215 RepID=UPI0030B30747